LIFAILIFGIALILLLRFIYASDWRGAFDIIKNLTWWQSVLIFLLPLIGHIINALRWKLILFLLKVEEKVKLQTLLSYIISGFSASYLLPSFDISGKSVRIFLLNKSGVGIANSFISLALEFFIGSAVDIGIRLGAIFILGLGWIFYGLKSIFWAALPLGILLSIIFSALFVPQRILRKIIPRMIINISRVSTFLEDLDAAKSKIKLLKENIPVSFAIFILSAMLVFFSATELWLILGFLGEQLSIIDALIISSAFHIAGIFPVIGGVGVLENIFYELFIASGKPVFLAFASIVIIRAKDLFWVLLGLFILSKNGISLIKKR
jgi:uncharacterized membrane protein YbhN (UPF0104 family)